MPHNTKFQEFDDDDPYDGMSRVIIPTEDAVRDFMHVLNYLEIPENTSLSLRRLIALAFDYAANERYNDEQMDIMRRLVMHLDDSYVGRDTQNSIISNWTILSGEITKIFSIFNFDMRTPPKFLRVTFSKDIVCLEKE